MHLRRRRRSPALSVGSLGNGDALREHDSGAIGVVRMASPPVLDAGVLDQTEANLARAEQDQLPDSVGVSAVPGLVEDARSQRDQVRLPS